MMSVLSWSNLIYRELKYVLLRTAVGARILKHTINGQSAEGLLRRSIKSNTNGARNFHCAR